MEMGFQMLENSTRLHSNYRLSPFAWSSSGLCVLLIFVGCLVELSFQTPIPQVTVDDGTVKTVKSENPQMPAPAPAPPIINSTAPKIKINPMKHGIFNSWLCGAGYIYNKTSKMCSFEKSFSEEMDAASAQHHERIITTTDKPSGETAEDEVQEKMSSFFPLECGMNYRYLRVAKVCKPKAAPMSSESDENQKDMSSDEE